MKKLLIILGCIIYVIVPIDILPDLIPILGWLDDLAVIGVTVGSLCSKK
jgi:uncharacterized membrane protein YkvA (DUF1232 family)